MLNVNTLTFERVKSEINYNHQSRILSEKTLIAKMTGGDFVVVTSQNDWCQIINVGYPVGYHRSTLIITTRHSRTVGNLNSWGPLYYGVRASIVHMANGSSLKSTIPENATCCNVLLR